jgi:hypothetical protein
MKRSIWVLLIIVGIGFAATQQNFTGFLGLEIVESDTVIANEVIVIDEDTFKATTQTNLEDTTLATKAYVDAGGSVGVTILDFDINTGIATIATTEGTVDTALFEGRYGYLTTDTLIIRNDSLILGNNVGVPLLDVIVDSVTNEYDELTGDLSTYWYIGATQYGPTVENLDGRTVLYSDSTDTYYSQHYLDSALAVAGTRSTWVITLPADANLALSVAAAVESTEGTDDGDYPYGWVLNASGDNLEVNHGLGRYSYITNVFSHEGGASYRQYRNMNDAYSGILNVDTDNTTIEGLTQDYTLGEIRITITFE